MGEGEEGVGEVAVAYAAEVKDALVAMGVKKLVGKFAPLQQTLPNQNKVFTNME